MAATAASAGDSPFMPREYTKANYIKGFSQLVVENDLQGILATAWDDGSPYLETVFRGYIAQGEFGWNPDGRTVEEFAEAHGQREFGLEAGKGKTDSYRNWKRLSSSLTVPWLNPAEEIRPGEPLISS